MKTLEDFEADARKERIQNMSWADLIDMFADASDEVSQKMLKNFKTHIEIRIHLLIREYFGHPAIERQIQERAQELMLEYYENGLAEVQRLKVAGKQGN